jgi:hypothetical protein
MSAGSGRCILVRLPEKWKQYTELNASYVQGSKFTPEEYARHQTTKEGVRSRDQRQGL